MYNIATIRVKDASETESISKANMVHTDNLKILPRAAQFSK